MKQIYPVLDEADMVVFASPVYWFSLTAQLKAAIDRFYAFLMKGYNIKCCALLVNAHDSEEAVFDTSISNYTQIYSYAKWENKGIIAIKGMDSKGAMKNAPELKDVYNLGRSL